MKRFAHRSAAPGVSAAMFGLLLLALTVVGITALRSARIKGLVRTARHCQTCGRAAPSTQLRFFKNTGMLILFRWEMAAGQLCRSCAHQLFLRMTLWTVTLGWWGLISFFVNLGFVANNLLNWLWAMTLPSSEAFNANALEQHREYALNLLATKDFDDVVYVLRQTSGASTEMVKAYLLSLRADVARAPSTQQA